MTDPTSILTEPGGVSTGPDSVEVHPPTEKVLRTTIKGQMAVAVFGLNKTGRIENINLFLPWSDQEIQNQLNLACLLISLSLKNRLAVSELKEALEQTGQLNNQSTLWLFINWLLLQLEN